MKRIVKWLAGQLDTLPDWMKALIILILWWRGVTLLVALIAWCMVFGIKMAMTP